jgi:hypothetical protein
MSNQLRCGSGGHYINALLHNRNVALRRLCYLSTILRRNMCNLTLSPAPVNEVFSEAVSYVCVSWIDHICAITEGANLVEDILEQFLFQHLLHWLEAMSILKKSRMTITLLQRLLEWLHVCDLIFSFCIRSESDGSNNSHTASSYTNSYRMRHDLRKHLSTLLKSTLCSFTSRLCHSRPCTRFCIRHLQTVTFPILWAGSENLSLPCCKYSKGTGIQCDRWRSCRI